ncbi:nucleotidyltransferase domain-containing protein [Bacillus salitolerans]|uniref:Nucleotidyltransferase domain-containing protein n=1 Tax=Bacillus salitolerans TaxID=1437434 RepID=A0ABW4LWQ5_9BACI
MEDNKWNPLSVEEIHDLFRTIPISWWIAGGWALDLNVGRKTREHDDIDIVIVRDEHLTLQAHLHNQWDMYKAIKGQLIPWDKDEILQVPIDSIWVKKKGDKVWAFQVMILDTEGDEWEYKRKNTIRKPIKDIGLCSPTGIPYLRPEIQLLYKGGSSVLRGKDTVDLENVLPLLANSELRWLKDSLAEQFPTGHQWMDQLVK